MGNPATLSKYATAKDTVQLAILPIGQDGRGNTYTEKLFRDFLADWRQRGSYPVPIVKTHDQDRDRPAVGWLSNFRITSTHLMGTAKLLASGTAAFYSTHPGWSAEVVIDQQNRLDIKQLALLGGERPHFKNLTEYSQFYQEYKVDINMENNLEQEQDYVEADSEELLQQLLDINDRQDLEIEDLKKEITELKQANQTYAEKAVAAEVEALYSEVISYGCTCDKSTIASNYTAMGAELRPQYKATLIDIAKSAKALAKNVVRQPNLLYGEEVGEPSVAEAKKKLRRLVDVH
jgi:hypothetical protein